MDAKTRLAQAQAELATAEATDAANGVRSFNDGPTNRFAADISQTLIAEANAIREKQGLPPLSPV